MDELKDEDSINQLRIVNGIQQNVSKLPEEQENKKRIPNGHAAKLFFRRYIFQQNNTFNLLLINMLLIFIYYEVDSSGNASISSEIWLYTAFGTIPFLIMLYTFKHLSYNSWKKSELQQNQFSSIKSLIFWCVILSIQPYPFLNNYKITVLNQFDNTTHLYKLNYIFVIFSVTKFCLIVPAFFYNTKYLSPRSLRINSMYGSSPNIIYTLKCLFKDYPITLILGWFFLSIVIFSFTLRVSQRTTYSSNPFDYYSNSVWLVLVTMTTVGYGDIYCKTTIGRLVGIFCMIWGGFTISVMVVVVTNTLELNQKQKRSLMILKRLELKKQIREISANYIRISLWRLWQNYKLKSQDSTKFIKEQLKQRKLKKQFNKMRRLVKSRLNDVDLHEDMMRHFERVDAHVENLSSNATNLIEHINSQYVEL